MGSDGRRSGIDVYPSRAIMTARYRKTCRAMISCSTMPPSMRQVKASGMAKAYFETQLKIISPPARSSISFHVSAVDCTSNNMLAGAGAGAGPCWSFATKMRHRAADMFQGTVKDRGRKHQPHGSSPVGIRVCR